MKVMLLMWSDGSYAGGDADEDYAAWMEYEKTLRDDGVFAGAGQFAETDEVRATTTTISTPPADPPRPAAGLSGYYLVDVADADAAEDYARRAPLYGYVEVRPIAEY
ncbi:YciI family protein [Microbacterium enclense]|uniref:YciI family protein n=1 Tax=Microbacterium enclense TaxID=993073 RepID=UPI0036DCB704